jgi:hypothetical protein
MLRDLAKHMNQSSVIAVATVTTVRDLLLAVAPSYVGIRKWSSPALCLRPLSSGHGLKVCFCYCPEK